MSKTLNQYNKEKFGCKVYKLSINAGFTCPNRDGTLSDRGCIFCSKKGSGEFSESGNNIITQLENAKKRVQNKNKDGKYIAYFQSFTNTYASIEKLEKLYFEAIKPDYIVGLNIATRPDCLQDNTIYLLKKINSIKPVTIELGLQTSNEKTAEYIRRGYKNEVYEDAVKRLIANGIEVVTHIIIGLPNETKIDALNTTEYCIKMGTNGVKFHLLHVIKNTDLEKEYLSGKFRCLELEEYADILKDCLELLPENTVVHRITGDGDKKTLVAPLWSADKKKVLNFLHNFLANNN